MPFEIMDFSPYGYDERQYCSPGFNLAVGSLTRTPHGRFPQYHTSADNLDFVQPEALAGSLQVYLSVLRILENNCRYVNLNPKCEPQLGKRGLYRTLGGLSDANAWNWPCFGSSTSRTASTPCWTLPSVLDWNLA